MNNKTLAVAFLSLVIVATGCDKDKTTSDQMGKMQSETKAAASDMKDFTYAQKSEFVKTMQAQMAALNEDMDKLSAKIESSSNSVKAEAKPKLQVLRDQIGKLNEQLDQAKDATESTWDSVKDGSGKAYESLKDGFQQTRQWVSDKIKP